MSIFIKNARLIDANTDKCGNIGISDGIIDFIGGEPTHPYDQTVDACGAVVMPALVDMHCHLRDPGQTQKESMETGMRAAISGGYATLTAMANTTPTITTPELIKANLDKARELDLCRLIQVAACGENLDDKIATDRAALRKYTNVFSNDGKTIFNDDFMRNLLIDSKKLDFVISTHCQPEEEIVARDLGLLKEVGGNLHIGHISTEKTANLVRDAKNSGLKPTCEVTPHHLIGCDSDYRVNPPIAKKSDNHALIKAIKDGYIDCLSTDHAPHTPTDKANGMAGISNIEYALSVFLKVFAENDIPLTRLAEMTSFTPRRLLGLGGGLLQKGSEADIIIVDVNQKTKIDKAKMLSRSNNTPFDGVETLGKVKTTIIKGKIYYDNGQFVR